jgi:glycosyltransferase involved in cell wall biosynthesis
MNEPEIIHVMHIASGDLWAGAEVQLFTLAKSQNDQQSMDVSVILLNHGMLEQRLRNSGVKVHVLDEKRLNGLQILSQLITTIHKNRPTLIHTHRLKENILGSMAALVNNKTPSLRTSHGAPEHRAIWYNIPKRAIQLMDRFCGRYMQSKIIAVSADLADILRQSFPANKIQVIENGIDITSLPTDPKLSARSTRRDSNQVRIGIAGRLVPVKRVDLFIKTAHRLLTDKPDLDLSFHIFGDGPLLNDLQSLNTELGTDTNVRFEGHKAQLAEELSDIDILLMTSDHEGLPMVLLEAMALKIPIIAHAVGGIPVLLDHGDCGLLVTDHSPAGYAAALGKLIDSADWRARLSENAYNRVVDKYSAKNNAAEYELTYREISKLS